MPAERQQRRAAAEQRTAAAEEGRGDGSSTAVRCVSERHSSSGVRCRRVRLLSKDRALFAAARELLQRRARSRLEV